MKLWPFVGCSVAAAIAALRIWATQTKASSKHGSTSMTTTPLPFDIQRARPDVQDAYRRMIATGVKPRLAEMLALQSPPGLKGTDRSFMQGRMNNEQLNAMPEDHARNLVTLAKRAGINVSGKYYSSGLADHRGPADPEAWVDSASDIKRVAEKRNLTVRGAVEHEGRPMPRPKSQPLSESATRQLMKEEKARQPSMKKGELREYVIAKYGRKPKD